MDSAFLSGLAGILAAAAPILFAAIGETLTERAGVTNLSVNGAIILTAMVGFVVAVETNSTVLGFLAGAVVGALVTLLLAFATITLKQSQVAVGFVLALLCRDLAYFLGNPYMGVSGPIVSHLPIPLLADIPIIGQIFFRHNLPVYASYLLVFLAFWWLFKTRPGLMLQGIGERPEAAFARGANVNRMRYFYTVLGGALVGIAGIMLAARIESGNPIAGNGFEFNSVAAVLLGGTSMREGRGSVIGTVFGVLLVQILKNGLVMANVSSIYQSAIIGIVVLFSIIVNAYLKRKE